MRLALALCTCTLVRCRNAKACLAMEVTGFPEGSRPMNGRFEHREVPSADGGFVYTRPATDADDKMELFRSTVSEWPGTHMMWCIGPSASGTPVICDTGSAWKVVLSGDVPKTSPEVRIYTPVPPALRFAVMVLHVSQ